MSTLPGSVCSLISFGRYLTELRMWAMLALQEKKEKEGRLETGADLQVCYRMM